MSWRARLEEMHDERKRPSCHPAKPAKAPFDPFAGEQIGHVGRIGTMPSPAELTRNCRHAVAGLPNVDADRLRRFLETAEDPEWCSERVARVIAMRMAQGLIRE